MLEQGCDAVIEECYWVHSPELFERAGTRLLETYPDHIQRYHLCTNDLGEPVWVFRLGHGQRNVVLLGRTHGHEPAGTCGLVALMDGLLSAKVPGTNMPYDQAERLLHGFTLECIPMVNPDAARRWASQVRDSFPALDYTNSPEDTRRLREIHSEPGLTLGKERPPHFTAEEVIEWRRHGKSMGSLFTEEGVELWMDWAHGRSMQIVALRELLRLRQTVLFVDIHQQELPSQIFIPTGLRTEEDRRRHEYLAEAALDAIEGAGIPCNRRVVPFFDRPDLNNSTNWAYLYGGSMQLLFEIDWGHRWGGEWIQDMCIAQMIPLSKAQIVMTVWWGITGLLLSLLSGFPEYP